MKANWLVIYTDNCCVEVYGFQTESEARNFAVTEARKSGLIVEYLSKDDIILETDGFHAYYWAIRETPNGKEKN